MSIEKHFGFLFVNKPVGITSHDVVDILRKITGIRKIGHAGTLDPFASGLLILAIGRQATKKISQFVKLDKEYLALLFLGRETDTYDNTGQVVKRFHLDKRPTKGEIKKVLKKFLGAQEQTPPMYSAKKIQGKKLYQLARKGLQVERQAVKVVINNLELLDYQYPFLRLKIKCSSGTYVRSLAFDIGRVLGSGAYLQELKRTKIGRFDLKEARSLEDLTLKNWFNFLFPLDKK